MIFKNTKIDIKPIVKTTYAQPAKTESFKNKIKFFISKDFNIESDALVRCFLDELHKVDYEYMFNKKFYFYYSKPKDRPVAGSFVRDDEIQVIRINKFWNTNSPQLLKKGMLLNTYFHENAHERQYDNYLYYINHNNAKCSSYQKVLNFELSSNIIPQYDFQLKEIDARMQSINRFCELLKSKTIPYNNLLVVEPILSALKNISVLTNLEGKRDYFNNRALFKPHNHIQNYSKIENIKFDIDKYINYYDHLVIDVDNSLDNTYQEMEEVVEVFNNTQLRYEFRKELAERVEKFKENVKFLYSLVEICYTPSASEKKYLPTRCENEDDLLDIKQNFQVYILKLMLNSYLDKYVRNYEKE